MKTKEEIRIEFYGEHDARAYDHDELYIMEQYAKEYHEQQVNLLNKPAVSKCVEPVAMDTLIDHYATKLLSCYTKSGIIEQLKHLISKVN